MYAIRSYYVQGDTLPVGGMQRDDRLAIAIVPRLDAREQERRFAQRRGRRLILVGTRKIRARKCLLVLEPEQRLACFGIRLRPNTRTGVLGELDEQRPQQLDVAKILRESDCGRRPLEPCNVV